MKKSRCIVRVTVFLLIFLTGLASSMAQVIIDCEKLDATFPAAFIGINDIDQDHLGYLWIGNQEGLHRFDGNNFTTYFPDKSKDGSLMHHHVNRIHLDKHGQLWIGTFYGLHQYNYCTDGFIRFEPRPGEPTKLQGKFINDMEEDSAGNLWLATYRGLSYFNTRTKIFTTFTPVNSSLPTRDIVSLYLGKDNDLLLGTKNHGVWKFKNGIFTAYETKHSTGKLIWDMLKDENNNLWIATEMSGVLNITRDQQARFFLPGQNVQHLELSPDKKRIVFNGQARDIETGKLVRMALKTNHQVSNWLMSCQTTQNLRYFFSSNGIFIQRQGSPVHSPFSHLLSSTGWEQKPISAIQHVNNNEWVVKTEQTGIFYLNLTRLEIRKIAGNKYSWDYKNDITLVENSLYYCKQDGLWQSNIYNPLEKLVLAGNFRLYLIDQDGWVNLVPQTDNFYQVIKFHPVSGITKNEPVKYDLGVLPPMGIIGAVKTHDSTLWLFSVEGETALPGLFCKHAGEKNFRFVANMDSAMANVFITDIEQVHEDKYLVGTQNGLFLLEEKTKKFSPVHLPGEGNQNIRSIQRGPGNAIWFVSNSNIYHFSPGTGKVKACYDIYNQSPFSYGTRSSAMKENHLYFGHGTGIISFHHDSMEQHQPKQTLAISEINYDDKLEKTRLAFPALCQDPVIISKRVKNITLMLETPGAIEKSMFRYAYSTTAQPGIWQQTTKPVISLANWQGKRKLTLNIQLLDINNKVLDEKELALQKEPGIKTAWIILFFSVMIGGVIFFLTIRLKKQKMANTVKTGTSRDETIIAITSYIEKNMESTHLGSGQIEEAFGMSRSGLFKLMKEKTGLSVTAYTREIKLQKAVELLKSGKHTVSEVIYMTGFNSRSYFYRCFKERFGKNPAELIPDN